MARKPQNNPESEQILQVISGYAKNPNTENLQALLDILGSTTIDNSVFSTLIRSSDINFQKLPQSEQHLLEQALHGYQNKLSDKVLDVDTRVSQEIAKIAFLKERKKIKKSNIKSQETSSRPDDVVDILKAVSEVENELNLDEHSELQEQMYEKTIAVNNHLRFQGMAEMLLSRIESDKLTPSKQKSKPKRN